MFIKFLDHDLRYGIGHAKKRLIVTFIMFFFLSIYHFWTLRILSSPIRNIWNLLLQRQTISWH